LFWVVKQTFLVQDSINQLLGGWLEIEKPFDQGYVGTGADEGALRPTAQKHLHGIYDDGFTGASFAREDDKARLQGKPQIFDNGEISDVKFV